MNDGLLGWSFFEPITLWADRFLDRLFYGLIVSWASGSLGWWLFGLMALWADGSLGWWLFGLMALRPSGSLGLWNLGLMCVLLIWGVKTVLKDIVPLSIATKRRKYFKKFLFFIFLNSEETHLSFCWRWRKPFFWKVGYFPSFSFTKLHPTVLHNWQKWINHFHV